jgi:hypothetical protein
VTERISGTGVKRHGSRGGSARRDDRSIPTATARWTTQAAPFYQCADGPDKSIQATLAARVIGPSDARLAVTLRSIRSLDAVNGPIWTKRTAARFGPSIPEIDGDPNV